MPHVVLLLWYAMMLAVQFGPLLWLVTRWERQDRRLAAARLAAGEPSPRLASAEMVKRIAISMAVLVPTFLLLTAPMHRATPALTIALGLGETLRD